MFYVGQYINNRISEYTDFPERTVMNALEFSQYMPKVELHVHLEGSIQPKTLLLLAERNKIKLPFGNENDIQDLYHFRDFKQFIENYWTITRCLCTAEDYQLIAYEFGRECHRQNILYSEVTFSMSTNMLSTGMPWQTIISALNSGREQAKRDFNVNWQWVFDIVRNLPDSQADLTNIAIEAQTQGVVALGLGGSEAEYPPELFSGSFERARSAGLRLVPHAGEGAGPPSIWNAIDILHADRIGHGVRSIEDPRLMDVLRDSQIPLEICPTSNIALGIYSDYAQHPLRKLWDAGILVTVNSDDPPMFNTCLNREYQLLVEHFGFTVPELERVSLNALGTSFLSDHEKKSLKTRFVNEFCRLRNG